MMYALLGGLIGGVGLFLLGMSLMTEGLKLAAGPALEQALARSTSTRFRGLLSGTLLTAVVQSSSAVTMAAIGFVNAGLLSLSQAIWVLFGANVGTTMTGWWVALVGLKFSIEALALPLIGGGMLLRVTGEGQLRGPIGLAVAGFGVLFLGIDTLQGAFAGLPAGLALPTGTGPGAVVLQVLGGVLLTVLMQSSSAALAVALTAAQGGLLDVNGAAAVVVGANVGTTVTAVIAAIGATPNARRAAAAHILFNVLTGGVALALLPWLVPLLVGLREYLGLDDGIAATLALFHTTFNVMGVFMMWPLAARLTRFLETRFEERAGDEARPKHLDKTVLAVPALALDALERELRRLGGIAVRMLVTALTAGRDREAELERDRATVGRLGAAVADFIVSLNRAGMSESSAQRLPQLLRAARGYNRVADLSLEVARMNAGRLWADSPAAADFTRNLTALLAELAQHRDGGATPRLLDQAYVSLRAVWLADGAAGRIPIDAMDVALRTASTLHRAAQLAAEARLLLSRESPPVS